MARLKCDCPIYCRYCGRRRSIDTVGHYCKTHNCQWQHGYSMCTLHNHSLDTETPFFKELNGLHVILTLMSGAKYSGRYYETTRKGRRVCFLSQLALLNKDQSTKLVSKSQTRRSFAMSKVLTVAPDPHAST